MYVYVNVCYVHMGACEASQVDGSPGTGVTGNCELPDMGAGN